MRVVTRWLGCGLVALAACGGGDRVSVGVDDTTTTTDGSTTTSIVSSSTSTPPVSAPEGSTTTTAPATTSSPSTTPRRPNERETDLGPGAWDGGRTTADGRALFVAFIGGPPWAEGDPCSVDYRAEAEETDDEVVLRFYSASPPATDDGPTGCTAAGWFRQVTVGLDRPLGERRLLAMGEVRRVFDGAELAALPVLPEGWSVVYEQVGFQPYGSTPPRDEFWQRHVGPPPPDGPCQSPAPESGITITEGPPELENREGRTPNGDQYQVRDAVATYWDGGTQVWLDWIEGGRGYSLSSFPSCFDEGTASLDRLLEMARSLVPPPPRT